MQQGLYDNMSVNYEASGNFNAQFTANIEDMEYPEQFQLTDLKIHRVAPDM